MSSTKVNKESTKEQNNSVPVKSRTDDQAHEDSVALEKRNNLSTQEKSQEYDRRPIREALEGKNVELSFPTPDTWQISKGGKTDTGSMTVPINAIVAAADKL